jgi:hypothetical protein
MKRNLGYINGRMQFGRSVFVALALLFTIAANGQINWPEITQVNKPWTRWWWEGSAVSEQGLAWNLQQYQKAGLGGVEITPIYGVHGYENQFVKFLTPGWMQLFMFTLSESKRLGLGVDLANATGWPFGGPWVKDKDASKTIEFKTYEVKGGEQLREPVIFIRQGYVRTANNKSVDINTIKNPLSLNQNLQDLALDQVRFPGRMKLVALVAYGDNGQAIDIINRTNSNGELNWTAPASSKRWTLYALFEGLHGKMVERAAPGGEGYAIDHFSKKAAEDYFKRFDEAFKGYDISYLRGFFNDSYEVDDAYGQANWTPALFEEFKKRKGYDLRNHLPALFGKDSEEKNSRVIYDYRSVIDALLLENFTKVWKKWGEGKGAILRNQSHGSPANTLDLYSVVDIPETEGTDILRFKFATSAANVTGKPLASSESCTWLNEHFLSSWGDVKKAIDLYFLGGVNHIFYHGTEYSPPEARWPGWLFYAAVHFQPVNPQWQHFHALNQYIAQVQSFLQNAKPDNDILLYYPIIDRYSEPGKALLQHFDGIERNFEHTDFEHVAREMTTGAFGFDFFSDRQLQKFSFNGNNIVTGGNDYRAILLPGNKLIDDESFAKLIALAEKGAKILVYKNLPSDVPGLGNLDSRRNKFRTDISKLRFTSQGINLQKAVVGKGAFYIGSNLEALMKAGGARGAGLERRDIFIIRKKNTDGATLFVNNRSDDKTETWIPLNGNPGTVALFDAMSGDKGKGKIRTKSGATEVLVQLEPHASVIIRTYKKSLKSDYFPYIQLAGNPGALSSPWRLSFADGGPEIPRPMIVKKLQSWTDFPEPGVKDFSGTGIYATTFIRPTGAAKYLLDLGLVHETCNVLLNGRPLATLVGPTFTIVIPATMLNENNTLEIRVANLMANRIAYMDRHQLPWKIFYNTNMPARKKENVKNGLFDASDWQPMPSGLLGPVTLTPLK